MDRKETKTEASTSSAEPSTLTIPTSTNDGKPGCDVTVFSFLKFRVHEKFFIFLLEDIICDYFCVILG